MTPTMLRALKLLRDAGPTTPATFGHAMWPTHAVYGRELRAQGAGYAGGGYLSKLQKRDLVQYEAGARPVMGHHINAAGESQSDKYPELKPDKIVVSFKHPEAWPALEALADGYEYKDPELAADIRQRLRAIGSTPPKAARDPDKFFLGSLTSWIATDVGGVPVKYIYPPPTMKAEWRIPVLGNDCDERAAEICELLNRMTFPEARAECEREQLNDQQRGKP